MSKNDWYNKYKLVLTYINFIDKLLKKKVFIPNM